MKLSNIAKSKLAIAALVIAACHPVYANSEQAQDATTELEQFCQAMHISAGHIMRRLNDGTPLQSVYRDLNRIESETSRSYLNQVATVADQFPRDTDPDQFAVLVYERCVGDEK